MPNSWILYEDEYLVAIDKPSGLLTVPGKSADKQDCVWNRLRQSHQNALVIHRLDRDTSGVLLFARSSEAQRELGRQFENRTVSKSYDAILAGRLEKNQSIELPMRRDMTISLPPTYIVDHEQGRIAKTELIVVETSHDSTRVVLSPHTGRSHQLRVHCRAIGHPILGDPIYGDEQTADRLMLHACNLSFRHPVTNDMLTIKSSPPF